MDKAAGNLAFICKKFYLIRLAQELGIENQLPGNDTYEYVNSSESDICDRILAETQGYNAAPGALERKLPLIYHNPKFHKNPDVAKCRLQKQYFFISTTFVWKRAF